MAQTRKTASKNDVSESIDSLGVIVGDLYNSIDETKESVLEFVGIVNKDTIDSIILNNTEQTTYLKSAANMLVAIAGYLLGDKGASLTSEAGSLLGKVKNADPILGNSPLNSGGGPSSEATLNVIVDGVDSDGLTALYLVLLELQEVYEGPGVQSIEAITMSVDALQQVVDGLSKLNFNKIDDSYVNSLNNFSDILDTLYTVEQKLFKNSVLGMFLQACSETLKAIPHIIGDFISGSNGKGGLVMIMNRYGKLMDSGQNIKDVIKLFEDVASLVKNVAIAGLFAKVAEKTAPMIKPTIETLLKVLEDLKELDFPVINGSLKNVKKAAELLTAVKTMFIALAVCGVLAIPAAIGALLTMLIMKVLIKLITTITEALEKINMGDVQIKVGEIAKLILIMGITMLVGALVGGFVIEHALDILGFAIVFTAFTFLISLSIWVMKEFMGGDELKFAQNLVILVGALALIMMVGALFMLTGLWAEALLFGIMLNIFMLVTFLPLLLLKFTLGDKIAEAVQGFTFLIIACALTMMIGAVFMLSGLWKEALLFGVILMVYVTMMVLPLIFFSIIMKALGGKKSKAAAIGGVVPGADAAADGPPIVQQFAIFIAVCALSLMIGALIIHFGLGTDALLFAVLFAAFVNAIVIPIALVAPKLKEAQKAMIMIAVIIGVGTLCLMLGAWFISKFGAVNALIFAVLLVSVIIILAGILVVIAQMNTELTKGMIAMGIISICMILGSTSMILLGVAFKMFGDWKNALIMVGIFAAMILAMAVLTVAAGAFLAGPQAAIFALGIVAIGMISGVTMVAAAAVLLIAAAYKAVNNATGGKEPDLGIMRSLIFGFLNICISLGKKGRKIKFFQLMKVCASVSSLAIAISLIGKAVGDFANLKVATAWDNKGNGIKFRQLSDADFKLAAEGVTKIVETLGKAVMDIYERNPHMFSQPGIGGLFGFGDTVFDKVTKSCGGLGKMISDIALGVSRMANLTVAEAWDSKGKPIKFRQLGQGDFDLAAENINKIVRTLGWAVIDIYERNPHLFVQPGISGWFGKGDTVFDKVTKSCGALGNMVYNIAYGVSKLANLTVATAWDAEGNPTKFRQMNDGDFDLAARNIDKIIRCLGWAIIDIYERNKSLFEVPPVEVRIGFIKIKKAGTGKTTFQKVVEACSSLGNMIYGIAEGVNKMANMTVATEWNSKGEPIKFRQMGDTDFDNATRNIKKIVTTLATALCDIYNENPHMFTGRFFGYGQTPFDKVLRSCNAMADMIAKIAKTVADMSNLTVATAWNGKGEPIKFRQLSNTDFENATKNITHIVENIFNTLIGIYNNNSKFFDTKITWSGGLPIADCPAFKVIFSAMLAGRMVSSLAQGVSDVANLRIATKWNKEGVAIDYRPLTDKDFENYDINVNKIITSTLTAIGNVYNSNPDLFQVTRDGRWWSWKASTPIQKVVNSARGAGSVISELAKATSDVLNLKIEDENGKKISVDIKDLQPGGRLDVAVNAIACGILMSLDRAYNNTGKTSHMEWTRDAMLSIVKPAVENVQKVLVVVDKTPKIDKNRWEMAMLPLIYINSILIQLDYIYDVCGKEKKHKWTMNAIVTIVMPTIENIHKLTTVIDKTPEVDVNRWEMAMLPLIYINRVLTQLDYIYDVCGKEKKHKWTMNAIVTIVIPTITYMNQLQTILAKNSIAQVVMNKKIASLLCDNLKQLFCAINSIYEDTPDGITKNMFWVRRELKHTIIPIVAGLITIQKLVSKTSLPVIIMNDVKLNTMLTNLIKTINNLGKLYDETPSGITAKMEWTKFIISSILVPVSKDLVILQRLLDKLNSDNLDTYSDFIIGLFEPFNDVKLQNIFKFNSAIHNKTARQLSSMVKSINSLNSEKVDKFTELVRELKSLNDSVDGFDELIEALNGRINETLVELSTKLELAASTIVRSDKAQEKRQALVKQNVAQLEKVLQTKMKLEVVPEESSSTPAELPSGPDNLSDGAQVTSVPEGQSGAQDLTPSAATDAASSSEAALLNDILEAIKGIPGWKPRS